MLSSVLAALALSIPAQAREESPLPPDLGVKLAACGAGPKAALRGITSMGFDATPLEKDGRYIFGQSLTRSPVTSQKDWMPPAFMYLALGPGERLELSLKGHWTLGSRTVLKMEDAAGGCGVYSLFSSEPKLRPLVLAAGDFSGTFPWVSGRTPGDIAKLDADSAKALNEDMMQKDVRDRGRHDFFEENDRNRELHLLRVLLSGLGMSVHRDRGRLSASKRTAGGTNIVLWTPYEGSTAVTIRECDGACYEEILGDLLKRTNRELAYYPSAGTLALNEGPIAHLKVLLNGPKVGSEAR